VIDFDSKKSAQLFEVVLMIHHERITYITPPLWSDIGGFAFLLYMVVGVFMFPVSEHLFIVSAIDKLFLARSSDSKLFPDSKRFSANKK
jgi:hypothetical protein